MRRVADEVERLLNPPDSDLRTLMGDAERQQRRRS